MARAMNGQDEAMQESVVFCQIRHALVAMLAVVHLSRKVRGTFGLSRNAQTSFKLHLRPGRWCNLPILQQERRYSKGA